MEIWEDGVNWYTNICTYGIVSLSFQSMLDIKVTNEAIQYDYSKKTINSVEFIYQREIFGFLFAE